MIALEKGWKSQQNVFIKQSSDTSSALQGSYCAVHLLAKESKPLSNGEFIKKMFASHNARDLSRKINYF
jgi:hypothetical protein